MIKNYNSWYKLTFLITSERLLMGEWWNIPLMSLCHRRYILLVCIWQLVNPGAPVCPIRRLLTLNGATAREPTGLASSASVFFNNLLWKRNLFYGISGKVFHGLDAFSSPNQQCQNSTQWSIGKSHHHTTTVLRPFFWDHPGEPVPEENFWTIWCKGRLTEVDTPTIRLGATPSGLTSAHLHHPPQENFFREIQDLSSIYIWIRKKMLEFSSMVLYTLSLSVHCLHTKLQLQMTVRKTSRLVFTARLRPQFWPSSQLGIIIIIIIKRWCLGWHYHAQNVAGPPNKH